MTIAKMDLLCYMSFRGRGDASSKLGFRVNVSSVFGVLMMMGLFLLGSLHAQTGQSTLTGVVSDSSGAIVSGARVNILNAATGVARTTVTDGSGLFSIQALNAGEYRVTVSGKGFQTSVTTGVVLSAGQTASLSPVLQVGKETVTVTVTTDSTLLNKDSSDVITTVNHVIVENLPYPERSSLEATLLVPGVNGDPLQPGGISTENPGAFTGYVTPGASISIGGGGPGVNGILVDGSDVTQASYARAGVNLSGLVVGETSVITAGMSAKYGRNGGGVIIQASRPGTNEYHGAITWRHTDPGFNAYPLGSTARSALHQNFYGFYAGGPVWIPKLYNGHNRTFFFAAFEPARLSNQFSNRGTFLTPDEIAGNLNNSLAVIDQTILKSQGAAAAIAAKRPTGNGVYYQTNVNAQGFPSGPVYQSSAQYRQVSGPLADCGSVWTGANPSATNCPNDVAPQLAQNAFAKFVLSQMPTPSNPGPYIHFYRPDGTWDNDGTNAFYSRGVSNTDNRYSIRIDHQFNNSNQVFVRYTYIPVIAQRYFAFPISNPLQSVPSDESFARNVALGYTHLFSDQLVNSFHFGYMRNLQNRSAPGASTDYAAKYGLTPAISGEGFPSLGSLSPAPYSGIGYGIGNAAIQVDQNFLFGDDFTWTHGSHLFQFGGDIRRIQSSQYDLSGLTGGRYGFFPTSVNGPLGAGSALGAFVLGNIGSYINTPQSVPGYYRWHYYAAYFQDDWHVTRNLTLNLGLRYEVETPRTEASSNQGFVRTDMPGTLNGYPFTAAFCFSNGCDGRANLWPINWKGFEPRVGIAYAPTSRTTVRAAYSMQRLPLTGYENTPDPNFNVASAGVGGQNGGLTPNAVVNYITNPVGPLSSAYTALPGRGPIYTVNGFAPVYVNQTSSVPYVQQWSLTMQYQLTPKTVFQATYQGLRGTHLIASFSAAQNVAPLNTPKFSDLVANIQAHANFQANSPNKWGIMQGNAPINESLMQTLFPYQNFFNQNLPEIYPRNGASKYNGMYLSVNQRVSAGLTFLANYTWSKTMDNIAETNTTGGSGFGTTIPQNPFDLSKEWSVALYDQPSRLKAGYFYALPFGRRQHFLGTANYFLNLLVGNITTSGIMSIQSGLPNTISLGNPGYFYSTTPKGQSNCTLAAGCISNALPNAYAGLRPDIIPGVPLINPNWKKAPFAANPTPYLNSAAFRTPGSIDNPAFGNAPRTLAGARSPREFMFDMTVAKGIVLSGPRRLDSTATFVNAFNHPVYFGAATRNLYINSVGVFNTPANFGNLNPGNTSGFSRVILVGAKFTF